MVPLTAHWYIGDIPPLTGVAVKLTRAPGQAGLADAAIDTLTGNRGFTAIVIPLDVAGDPLAQRTFEVRTQVIRSLFTGV